jgi:hypothetical protein
MIPLAAPLIMGGLQAGLGFLSGKSKAKQAAANAAMAAKLARIDTEYAPYGVAQKGYSVQPNTSTDSGLGGALSGGFSGAMQGLNVYRGLQGDKMNEERLALLKKLVGASNPLSLDMSGSDALGGMNAYIGQDKMVDLSALGL